MRAISLVDIHNHQPLLTLKQMATPVPEQGQVLIKIEVAPVNPSDVMFLQGRYIFEKALPVVPCFVAAGTVVASGGGLMGRYLEGKRVCCGGLQDSQGTWADYLVVKSSHCIPLAKHIDFETGCNLFANPLAAYGLMQTARSCGHKAFVQNAAAGDLGLLMQKLCRQKNIPPINIVHSEEQEKQLSGLGAEYVLNSSLEDFEDKLSGLSNKLNATMAFDAISGPISKSLLHAMPDNSELCIYGRLSNEPLSIDGLINMVHRGQRISGFSLYRWTDSQSLLSLGRAMSYLQKHLLTGYKPKIQKRVSLSEFIDNYALSFTNTTAGKTFIYPSR